MSSLFLPWYWSFLSFTVYMLFSFLIASHINLVFQIVHSLKLSDKVKQCQDLAPFFPPFNTYSGYSVLLYNYVIIVIVTIIVVELIIVVSALRFFHPVETIKIVWLPFWMFCTNTFRNCNFSCYFALFLEDFIVVIYLVIICFIL